MLNYKCDICQEPMEGSTEHLMSAQLGGQVIDIKIGINRIGQGDQCPKCIRKALLVIAEKGMFVGRRITLPENIEPLIAAREEKHSWSLR